MKKCILILTVLLFCMGIEAAAAAETEAASVTLTVGGFRVPYSDGMLTDASPQPDKGLAEVAVALSSVAWNEKNAADMLKQMGFPAENISSCGSYARPCTVRSPHGAAFTVAHKVSGEYTLYVVTVRGTSGNEWYSNFDLGLREDGYHEGFYLAAEPVYDALASLFDTDGSSPEKRIVLVTGHSRGAAVANIVAGRLTEAGCCRVYGYTFACPAIRRGTLAECPNLFNFNIDCDLVTYMPLESWGFGRFGTDVTGTLPGGNGAGVMSRAEITFLMIRMKGLVPDPETYQRDASRLIFSIIAWSLAGHRTADLPAAVEACGVHLPEAYAKALITGQLLQEEQIRQIAEQLNTLYVFSTGLTADPGSMTEKEFLELRGQQAELFAMYDAFAGETVTAETLDRVNRDVETVREALLACVNAREVLTVFYDAEKGTVKDSVFTPHDLRNYMAWMHQGF